MGWLRWLLGWLRWLLEVEVVDLGEEERERFVAWFERKAGLDICLCLFRQGRRRGRLCKANQRCCSAVVSLGVPLCASRGLDGLCGAPDGVWKLSHLGKAKRKVEQNGLHKVLLCTLQRTLVDHNGSIVLLLLHKAVPLCLELFSRPNHHHPQPSQTKLETRYIQITNNN